MECFSQKDRRISVLKIIFILLAGLFGITNYAISAPWDKLPKSIQKMVLNDLGFYKPVEKSLTSQLFISSSNENAYFSSFQEMDASMTGGVGVKTYLWKNKFFIPYGYLRKFQQTNYERGQFNSNEYEQMWGGGIEDLAPTEKLRPYLRKSQEGVIYVTLAKRVLKSIDYANKWKIPSENLDAWSFTFSYFLEPVLPDLPKLGPFTNGKGTAILNPATGQWETRFGPNYGSSLVDGGDNEYTARLENQSTPKPQSHLSSGAPSPRPSEVAQSQLPSQVSTKSNEKITMASLTRNVPDTDYFAEESKIFDSSFDTVWSAAHRYFERSYYLDTSDSAKGILLTKKTSSDDSIVQFFTLVEKNSEDSSKVIVKGFSYRYNRYQPPHQNLDGWYKGEQTFASEIALRGIEKEIGKEVKKQKKQGYFVEADGKQYYFVTVAGKRYKVSGDIFTGKKEGRFFINEKGNIVRDLALAKKIAQSAWVYENIVRPSGPPNSKKVSAILSTYKALRRYEVAQDIIARVSVQILAATISGGTTLTYTVPAGLTWRIVHDQFVNLKGLLSLTGRQGLEEALSKYQQMESLVAKLRPNHVDEATAAEIKRLYDSAYVLDLPYSALLARLMPKKGRELVDKALKDIGDELVKTLPLSDAALTTREVLDLQGKMDDALKTDPALKEYCEKLNLAKRLTEANEQVITAWAEQAVKYKK